MRESYVSEVMRGNGSTPKIAKFRSSEVSAAYILACDKPDANAKLVKLSLNGLQMLLNYEVVPPSEAKNILRVLGVQAKSGNTEIQLKVLQIVLQLANSLSVDIFASQYLTVENVCGMITLALQLCGNDMTSVSVSSTAFATVRQLVALIMDATSESVSVDQMKQVGSHASRTTSPASTRTSQDSLPSCAELLVTDLALFLRGKMGEWIKGVSVPLSSALDLMYAVLSGWPHLFINNTPFNCLLKQPICTAIVPLLRTLQEDYVSGVRAKSAGGSSAVSPAMMTSKVVRLARCILLDFQQCPELMLEIETITTCLVHTLQPERGVDAMVRQLPVSAGMLHADGTVVSPSNMTTGVSQRYDDQTATGLMSRLAISKPASSASTGTSVGPCKGSVLLPLAILGPMLQPQSSPQSASASGTIYIPSHPAGACLEAVLAMLLNDDICCIIGRGENGKDALPTILTSVILTAASMLAEALAVESNVKDLEAFSRGSQLVTMMEGVLTGSSEMDRPYVVRAIHDLLFNGPSSIGSVDVMMLAFLVLQIASRLLVRGALATSTPGAISEASHQMTESDPTTSPIDSSSRKTLSCQNVRGRFFPSSSDGLLLPVHIAASYLYSDSPQSVTPVSSSDSERAIHPVDLAEVLRTSSATVCERTFEKVQEACLGMLSKVSDTGVIRRSLGILSELALTAGLLGLQRTCDTLISTLCRLTVPQWHGQELLHLLQEQEKCPVPGLNPPLNLPVEGLSFRWRHVQSLVRLTQVVHVLGDVITDWETIMDSFEQLIELLLMCGPHHTGSVQNTTSGGTPASTAPTIHEELTPLDIDRIFQCIERFKGFTVFISDEALIRLMTSLVALSLNGLAVTATSMGQSSAVPTSPAPKRVTSGNPSPTPTPRDAATVGRDTTPSSNYTSSDPSRISHSSVVGTISGPIYMLEALSSGALSYSLHAAVEVAKLNAFRMSCVWQMVTSHLRMMSAHKVAQTRHVSVAATHDVINTTLNYMRNSTFEIPAAVSFVEDDTEAGLNAHIGEKKSGWSNQVHLSDDVLYDYIMPSFETVFAGRQYQRELLLDRNSIQSRGSTVHVKEGPPQLTQTDLLSALKGLASHSKFADVRVDVMQGLLELLQGGGQAVSGGWGIIIELLTAVPSSMAPIEQDTTSGNGETRPESYSDDASTIKAWPDAALQTSFSCIKLIVDDFLDVISEQKDVIKDVITCLSMFSAQQCDVNISLTSVEMLWKVTDFIMTTSREKGDEKTTSAVLEVMLRHLLLLSMDQRPEIRNCATNTLFSAVVTNAPMLSNHQWMQAFDDVVFPLFLRVETRSGVAMRSNEEAKAPEIKRGVKMTLHHSRDNAHKQWSETRVLALRGLSRVMRICVKHLLTEEWFQDTWTQALQICVRATQAAELDLEVALAGVDSLFDMIKIVSSKSYKTKTRAAQGMRVVGGALVNETPSNTKSITSDGDHDVASDGHQEVARQMLWSMAWSTIRLSVCFTSVGCDLPLHLCKHLQELYTGGTEAEFRYSQNIKGLLEMLAVLSRPRVSVSVTNPDSASSSCVLEFVAESSTDESRPTSKRLGKVAESQLHRGVMSLLQAVRPTDVMTFSCLVSCMTDLAFSGCHYAQLSSPKAQDITTSQVGDDSRRVIFAPVDVTLRTEVCKYLISILSPSAGGENVSSGEHSGKTFSVPSTSAEWLASAVDVVSRRFVDDLCSPLLCTRIQRCFDNPPTGTINSERSHRKVATAESYSSKKSGIFTSLAKLLTIDSDSEDEEEQTNNSSSGKPTPCQHSQQNIECLKLTRILVKSPSGAVPENPSCDMWSVFPLTSTTYDVLAVVFEVGLPALRTMNSSPRAVQFSSTLNQLLSVLACLLSPWLTYEELLNCVASSDISGPYDVLCVKDHTHHPQWRQEHRQADEGQFRSMIEVSANCTSRVLDAVSHHIVSVSSRSHVHSLRSFVDVLVSSCRMITAALSSCSAIAQNDKDCIESHHPLWFHLRMLKSCKKHLFSVIAPPDNDNSLLEIQKRALIGSLIITEDLSELCAVPMESVFTSMNRSSSVCENQGSIFVSSSELHNICAEFLNSMLSVRTSIDMLPSLSDLCELRWSESDRSPSLLALQRWCCVLEELLVVMHPKAGSPEKDADKMSSALDKADTVDHSIYEDSAALETTGHLFLCSNIALRLVYSPSNELRNSAFEILRCADAAVLVSAYRDTSAAAKSLQSENAKLTKDLYSVRSAASLQF
eukprot:CAMPEP_0185034758 /NCGR_PEP_ID=MMETSP1103-20130426/24887_1 /TAXON_ID=36769 /ORGANISM="Paraphysomonas bandaiensis, Strain Caron Lab Isolate" /LENGTH=2224 /DNA_ID=CAMNT_0027571539 /DNA_START=141 /DNA_END=6815 /DNA_ORIENTATION=+